MKFSFLDKIFDKLFALAAKDCNCRKSQHGEAVFCKKSKQVRWLCKKCLKLSPVREKSVKEVW